MRDSTINYLPRAPLAEVAYTVTPCRSCNTCSAIEIEPSRYVCLACGETGVVAEGGWANVPDVKNDKALWDASVVLCKERASMREFRKLARARRKRMLVAIEGGKA